jgi:hypothetical protein
MGLGLRRQRRTDSVGASVHARALEKQLTPERSDIPRMRP